MVVVTLGPAYVTLQPVPVPVESIELDREPVTRQHDVWVKSLPADDDNTIVAYVHRGGLELALDCHLLS